MPIDADLIQRCADPSLTPVNGGVKPGHWAVQNPASTAGTQASAGRA